MEQKQNKQPKAEPNQPIKQPKPVKSQSIGQSVSNGVKIILYSGMILVIVIGLLWSFNRQTPTTNQDNANNYLPVVVNQQAAMTIEMIIEKVNNYCADGQIEGEGLCNSLRSKLDAAIEARDRGQYQAACNQLNALSQETGAQKNKKMTSEATNRIVEAAGFACAALPVPTWTPAIIFPTATPTVTPTEMVIIINTPDDYYPTTTILPSPTTAPSPTPTPTFEPLNGQPIGGYIFSTARPIWMDVAIPALEWLPENPNKLFVFDGDLSLIDIHTGYIQKIETEMIIRHPVWLSKAQKAAYLSWDIDNPYPQHLWFNDGIQEPTLMFTTTTFSPLIITPDEEGVILFDDNWQLQQVGSSNPKAIKLPPDVSNYKLPNLGSGLDIAIQSTNKTKVVYHDYYDKLLLVDFATGTSESIQVSDLEPYGLSLAANTFGAVSFNRDDTKLAVITGKSATGSVRQLFVYDIADQTWQLILDEHYSISEAIWAPDNQHLLIIRSLNDYDEQGDPREALFLIDTETYESYPVAAVPTGAIIGRLRWSPDGKYIAISYRDSFAGPLGLYIIEVQQ